VRSLWRTQGGWSVNNSPRGELIFVTWSPKIFHEARRCLDDVEFENQGTLIDVVNNAHKRSLFAEIEDIRQIKDIRNEIVHEYLDEALQSVFMDVLKTALDLIKLGQNTLTYVHCYHLLSN